MQTHEKKTLKQFYDKLMSFKDETDFHKFGFGRGGPYFSWLDDLKHFQKPSKISDDAMICSRYLNLLGYAYIRSHGEENDLTKWHTAFSVIDEEWHDLVDRVKKMFKTQKKEVLETTIAELKRQQHIRKRKAEKDEAKDEL